MVRDLEYTFLQRKHTNSQQVCEKNAQITNHFKKIKAIMTYHFIPVRMIITKVRKCWSECAEIRILEHFWNVK
jgi:hypothetical protein